MAQVTLNDIHASRTVANLSTWGVYLLVLYLPNSFIISVCPSVILAPGATLQRLVSPMKKQEHAADTIRWASE